MLDLRKTPAASVANAITWLDRNGHQHWKPGTPEWEKAFGAEDRFKPNDRVRALKDLPINRAREGQEFIVIQYHYIMHAHPSSGRMVECYKADDKYSSWQLVMESELEFVPVARGNPHAR